VVLHPVSVLQQTSIHTENISNVGQQLTVAASLKLQLAMHCTSIARIATTTRKKERKKKDILHPTRQHHNSPSDASTSTAPRIKSSTVLQL
jgi:hypothetical protein